MIKMDELTLWMQNDLGLTHMNETHLRGLIYHPRHGSLCRRFINLLKESTLLTKKNPGLTATDDLNKLQAIVKEKSDKLETIKSDLNKLASSREREELRIIDLNEQIEVEQSSNKALELAASTLEKISERPKSYSCYKKNLEDLKDALSNISDNIYSNRLVNDLKNKTDTQQATLDKAKDNRNYDRLAQSVEALINIISNLLNQVSSLKFHH